jgi:hypothetical protein
LHSSPDQSGKLLLLAEEVSGIPCKKNGNLYYNKDINTDKTKVKGEEYVKLGENNMFGEETVSACDEMIFNDPKVSENFAKDNGFKKADKEKTVIEKSMTTNYTDADGNEWTGNPIIEVECLPCFSIPDQTVKGKEDVIPVFLVQV